MTMHIASPALTTNNTRRRKEKLSRRQQAELEQGWKDRNQRLKEMGLPKETLEQYIEWVYGRGKKTKKTEEVAYTVKSPAQGKNSLRIQDAEVNISSPKKTSSIIPEAAKGPVSTKPSPTYTGTKIIGVATMHKSNLVPVFSDEEAEAVAKMRRG